MTLTILSLEDEADVREALERDLEDFWSKVRLETAQDVEDAWDAVEEIARDGDKLAVVLSDRRAGTKRLHVGARHAGEQWLCVLGGHEPVTIGDDGDVELSVSDGGLSVYAPQTARPVLDNATQYLLRQR